MKKYYSDLVDKGFDVLHQAMVEFLVRELKKRYGSRWWEEVLNALNDQRMLPGYGDDDQLIECLDRANCCRLLSRKHRDLFYDPKTANNCKTWAIELMGVRNELAHHSVQDMPQKDAERYLDTMVRITEVIAPQHVDEIRELYQEARSNAPDIAKPEQEGYYPMADQSSVTAPDLLSINDTEIVEPTGLNRKLTINGETLAYPVYRVRLDKLFYNDRNDRILTWITQYKDETAAEDLSALSREDYNRLIEDFIVKSNPAAIEKTRNSIALVNQREPGVTLSDGRIVDGNRRFTCLRMLHREDPSFNYFETVILNQTPSDSAKQIKLLELAIQLGEEGKVDYSPLELVIGAYQNIIETGLISVEEYASAVNEPVSEVRKKLEVARLIVEFLDFTHTPGQYHIARDLQVYTVFVELLPLLNKCKTEREKDELKRSVFTNAMLSSFTDQRKYVRNLRSLYGTQPFKTYMQRESKAADQINTELENYGIGGMEDLSQFIEEHAEMKDELALSMEKALNQSRKAQTRNKPAKNVAKCIDLLLEIDTDLFTRLTEEELSQLKTQFAKLAEVESMLKKELPGE